MNRLPIIRRTSLLTLAMMAGLVLSLSGCQAKLNVVQTFMVPTEESIAKIFIMPAQAGGQTITVDIKVKSGPSVDVFVIPANLVGETVGNTPNEKKEWESKGFGTKKDMKSGSMTAKVPAKADYKVLIIQSDAAKEKSNVEIKITN